MKIIKKLLLAIVLVLIAAQFFGPQKNEGDVKSLDVFIAETKPDEEVHKILKQACFDCHSNTTKYPWYNSITPVNYWIAEHVKDGKKHLNFSDWSKYSVKKKEHKMDELHEEVEEHEMPLNSYTWMHSEAKLTQEQIDKVVSWAKQMQSSYKEQMTKE